MLKRDQATRFGELRSLLNDPHRRGVWAAIRALLRGAQHDATLDDIADYVAHHLVGWPDVLRRSSEHWCVDLARGELEPDAMLWTLVRHVQLRGETLEALPGMFPDQFHELIDAPWLDAVTHLELQGLALGDAEVAQLARRFAPGQLKTLNLCRNEFSEEGVKALADAHHLRGLQELDLTSNHWGGYEGALGALISASWMPQVKRLMLECDLTRIKLEELLAAPQLAGLVHLGLRAAFDDGHERAIESIGAPSRFAALNSLDLSDNSLEDDDLSLMLEVPWFETLRALKLDWNELTGEGLASLSLSGAAHSLCELGVRGCAIGERGARVLLTSRRFGALTHLDVSSTYGLAESEAFSEQPPRLLGIRPSGRFWFDVLRDCGERDPRLLRLNLSDLHLSLGASDAEQLVMGHATRHLQRLDVANCTMQHGALEVWLDVARGFGRLEVLNLNRNDEIAEWFESLLTRRLPDSLKVLMLRDVGLRDDDIEAMCDLWQWDGLDVLDLRDNYFSVHVQEKLQALVVRARCDVLWDLTPSV